MNRHTISQRILAAVLACSALLSLTAAASAMTSGWQGRVGIGLGNGQCPFYSGQSACSPYAAWYRINAAHKGGHCSGTVLAGFENSSAIRGVYLDPFESQVVYEANLFASGANVKGTVTFCTWLTRCVNANGAGTCSTDDPADIWYQAAT
jgi:hypothetical protein